MYLLPSKIFCVTKLCYPITSSRYYSFRGENDSKQSDEFQARPKIVTWNQDSEEYNRSSDISRFAQDIYKPMKILTELCKQASF